MNPLRKALALIVLVVGIAIPAAFVPTTSASQVATFDSYNDLINFIHAQPPACPASSGSSTNLLIENPKASISNGAAIPPSASSGSTTYSQTNVQVTGVDELDTVKNDGQNIYTITNNTLVIVKAYPVSDARVLAKISVNGTLTGVFVSGNRLVLIGGTPQYYPGPLMVSSPISATMITASLNPVTNLWLYDISNPSSPSLTLSLKESGSYVGSRLISNQVYLITTENLAYVNDHVELPQTNANGQLATIPATQIYHSFVYDYWYSFTNIVQVNLSNPSQLSSQTFLISTSSTIYVSTSNIYLTSASWSCGQQTVIHRISIGGSSPSYQATGTVPGTVLNQFSMDEGQGYFRIVASRTDYTPVATPGGATGPPATPAVVMGRPAIYQQETSTSLYVLDMGLHTVGRAEGISPGEIFYAARFLGDRAYLVTYQRVDPLFVVDLQDPHQPKVLGQLQVTGVSDYLQPYDENHLIGFGKSSVNVTWENAALFQGLKLSLFDVTDPTHPIDISDYPIGDRGSDSPALTDSHSVLFDRNLNLLVIPVQLDQAQSNSSYPWSPAVPVWQGAYVFNVSPSGGIVFRGGITHLPNSQTPVWGENKYFVSRALYIGNVLYTISPSTVRMSSLTDLSDLGSVSL
jgi:inhibitor of cysteine peptidase